MIGMAANGPGWPFVLIWVTAVGIYLWAITGRDDEDNR